MTDELHATEDALIRMAAQQARRAQLDKLCGLVLEIPKGSWRNSDGALRIRVGRVLHERNRILEDWLWIDGVRLDPGPEYGQWINVLVRVAALPISPQTARSSE